MSLFESLNNIGSSPRKELAAEQVPPVHEQPLPVFEDNAPGAAELTVAESRPRELSLQEALTQVQSVAMNPEILRFNEGIRNEIQAAVFEAELIGELETPADCERLVVVLDKLKALKERIGNFFDPAAKIASTLHKTITGLRGALETERDQHYRAIDRQIIAWKTAEQKRLADLQRKADELHQREVKRLEEQAKQAEASGDADTAEQLREEAAFTPTPIVRAPVADTKGYNVGTSWQVDIESQEDFIIGLAEDIRLSRKKKSHNSPYPALDKMIDWKLGALKKAANDRNGNYSIPGLKVTPESKSVNRRKA